MTITNLQYSGLQYPYLTGLASENHERLTLKNVLFLAVDFEERYQNFHVM